MKNIAKRKINGSFYLKDLFMDSMNLLLEGLYTYYLVIN